MKIRLLLPLCLAGFACLGAVGCSAVYAPNGLPEELRADVPGLEGAWTLREAGRAPRPFTIARSGAGSYSFSATDAETGSRLIVRARTYAVSGRSYALLEWTGTDPKDGTVQTSPFPAVVRLAAAPEALTVSTLRGEFLKANPSVLPYRPLVAGGRVRDGEYVVTATARQLADFLTLVADNPEAWTSLTGPDATIVRAAAPREAASPSGGASAARRPFWRTGLFWAVLLSAVAGGAHELYRRRRRAAAVGDLRRTWVDAVVRLLVIAVRSTRDEQALRDRERSLIEGVAVREAERPDAPGEPAPLGPGEAATLVRCYAGDCPGVAELMSFLGEPANAGLRTRLLKRVWQAAVCDGPASDAEVAFVRSLAADTAMTEEEFVAVSLRYHRPRPPEEVLEEARALLELPRTATIGDVKKAYKRKAREYHPDAHVGAAENLRRLAAERFSKLGDAKEALLAALGQVPLAACDPSGRLVLVEDLPEKVRCFCCGAVRPGVSAAEASSARCPRCLALLYQEPGFAAELARETREVSAS